MDVLSHNGERVLLQVNGRTFELIHCVDRYTLPSRGPEGSAEEEVQIWEDDHGAAVRLSKRDGPKAEWKAKPWG